MCTIGEYYDQRQNRKYEVSETFFLSFSDNRMSNSSHSLILLFHDQSNSTCSSNYRRKPILKKVSDTAYFLYCL